MLQGGGGRLAVLLLAVAMLVVPASASAVGPRFTVWYGSGGGDEGAPAGSCWEGPSCVAVGAGYLSGHVTTGGGTGAEPWTSHYGDYCNYYRLSPLDAGIADSLGDLTGLTTPTPDSSYQLGSQTGSGCEASGDRWAEAISGTEPGADCSDVAQVCGMQHSVSFGEARYYLPWYAPRAYLILASSYEPAVFRYSASNSNGWGYLCALLEDTTTGQRLEYCLNEWSSWGAAPDGVSAFPDPYIDQGFANVQTNFDPGTRFATEEPGSHDTIAGPGAVGAGHTYEAAITSADLDRAVAGVNAQIEGEDGGTCPARQPTCYSTAPGGYQLIGLENGQEMWGDVTYLGGNEAGLWAATVVPGTESHLVAPAHIPAKRCRDLSITPLSRADARRLTSSLLAGAAGDGASKPLGPAVVTGPAGDVAALAGDPGALWRCAQDRRR